MRYFPSVCGLRFQSILECFHSRDQRPYFFKEKKKVFALQKSLSPSGLIWIPTWPTFHCLGTPIWPTDFTGKHCLRLLSVRSCDSTAYPSLDLFTHKQFILAHHFMDISTLVKLLAGLFICDQYINEMHTPIRLVFITYT